VALLLFIVCCSVLVVDKLDREKACLRQGNLARPRGEG
jgi:hypothetical protein